MLPGISNSTHEVGLDVGRYVDYSALCIMEVHQYTSHRRDPFSLNFPTEYRFIVRHLERFQKSYTDTANYVSYLLHQAPFANNSRLVYDRTGVGDGLTDLFKASRMPARIKPVVFTAGHEVSHNVRSDSWSVPKQTLLSHLHTVFTTKHLYIPRDLALAPILLEELASLQVNITKAGNATFEPESSTQHDDLAFSVALATFFAIHDKLPILRNLKSTPRLDE